MKCRCGEKMQETINRSERYQDIRAWRCGNCGRTATSTRAQYPPGLLRHSAKVQHLKAFIRSPHAFPGGYTLIAVMDDGEIVCHECTRDNFREIVECTKNQERIGWNFIDVTINWEDPSMYCAHCDEPLTPEYCEHEQEAAAAV